jgi:general secretion pathway protein K
MMRYVRNRSGMALVITLLALVLITAMVVEFSYGVYTGTGDLYNWRDSQRLSLMARSGVSVSAKFLTGLLGSSGYSYPGYVDMPVENPFEDFSGVINVRIEDETSKFNINSIIYPNGDLNMEAYDAFRRLLKILLIDEKVADRIADWIDPDSEQRIADSEAGAKNSALFSVDELLLINGINRKIYDTLLPYVTVYGTRNNLEININGAEKPVLMSLSENINDDLAQRVTEYRRLTPFEQKEHLQKVPGFGSTVYNPVSGMITVKGRHFAINSSAESDGVKRIVEAVLDASLSPARFEYWKEY